MVHITLWKRLVGLLSFLLLPATTLVGATTSSAKQAALAGARPLATALCCAVRLVTVFTAWPLVLLVSNHALSVAPQAAGETVLVPPHTRPVLALCAAAPTASFLLRLALQHRCPDIVALARLSTAAASVPLLLAHTRPPAHTLSFGATIAAWISYVIAALPDLAQLRAPPSDYRARHAAGGTAAMLYTSFCGVFAGLWAAENRMHNPLPVREGRSPLCTQRVVELGPRKTLLFVCDALACPIPARTLRALARFVAQHARETALRDRLHARLHVLLRDTPSVRAALAPLTKNGDLRSPVGASVGVLVPLPALGTRTVAHLLPESMGAAAGYCAAIEAQTHRAPQVYVLCNMLVATKLCGNDWTALGPLVDQMLYGNSALCATAVIRFTPVFCVHNNAAALAMGGAAVRALASLDHVFGACCAEEATSLVVCQQQGVDKFVGILSHLTEARTVAFPLSMMVGTTHDTGRPVACSTRFLKRPSHTLSWRDYVDDACKAFQEQCWALDHMTTVVPFLQHTAHKRYWCLKYVALVVSPTAVFVESAWIASALLPNVSSLFHLLFAVVVLGITSGLCLLGTRTMHTHRFEKGFSTTSITLATIRAALLVSTFVSNIIREKQGIFWLTVVCAIALGVEAVLVVLRNFIITRQLKQCFNELLCGLFFLLMQPFFECFTIAVTLHKTAKRKTNDKQEIGFHPWHLIKALLTVDVPGLLISVILVVLYPRWVISGLPLVVLCLHSIFMTTRLVRTMLSRQKHAFAPQTVSTLNGN